MDVGVLTVQTGLVQGLYIAFLGGLAASFTPCVYPLIPITLSIFGATGDIPRAKAFLLSLTYVLGIAVTYTGIGIFSAFTGALFGQALGNPWVVAGMCVFLFAMSLYTLEIFTVNFAYQLQTKASQVGGKGFVGAFLMGAASGVVAAPCAAPILITILGIAASTKNPWWGGSLLFAYAIGFGLIFLVLGTFSGLLKKIPRSGNWLHGVKFIIAVAVLMVALFLLQPYTKMYAHILPLQNQQILILLAAIAFVAAIVSFKVNLKTLKVMSATLAAFSLFYIFVPQIGANEGSGPAAKLTWLHSIDEGKKQAQLENRLMMVDFFAEWCAACKELDAKTFPHPIVVPELSKFVLVRMDMTVPTDATEKLQEDNSIIGLPSLLFFRPDGTEVQGKRVEGFKDEKEFLAHLKAVGGS